MPPLVAGMVAGADSINDMDLLRRGGMGRLFSGVRAPSTLGIFLRAFTVGHVRQLDAVDSRFMPRPAGQAPILAGAERMVWLGRRRHCRQTYGYAKQTAGRGYTGVKGLNAMVATASTPMSGAGDRRNAATSGERPLVRGAATLVTEALQVARPLWSLWTGYSSRRFGVLYPRHGHRGPRGRSPIQYHRPALPIGDQGQSPPSPTMRGPRSATPQAIFDEAEQTFDL